MSKLFGGFNGRHVRTEKKGKHTEQYLQRCYCKDEEETGADTSTYGREWDLPND